MANRFSKWLHRNCAQNTQSIPVRHYEQGLAATPISKTREQLARETLIKNRVCPIHFTKKTINQKLVDKCIELRINWYVDVYYCEECVAKDKLEYEAKKVKEQAIKDAEVEYSIKILKGKVDATNS